MKRLLCVTLAWLLVLGCCGLTGGAWAAGPGSAEGPTVETSPAETPLPVSDTEPPAEGSPAPAEGSPVPAEGSPAPAEGSPAPAEGSPAPAEGSPAPAEGSPAPAEGSPAPAEGSPAPAEGSPAPAEGSPAPAEGSPAPAEGSPAPAEGAPGAQPSPAASPAAPPETTVQPAVYSFSGKVQELAPDRLVVLGKSPSDTDLTLTFALDDETQKAEGLKVGDTVVVLYEVVAGNRYRATSVRFPSDGLPANTFPPETAPGAVETPEPEMPRVVNIEVEGNSRVPTDEILQVISTRIGDPILEPRLRRDLQAIFDMGYFTDVRVDTRPAPGGARLVFRVLENPVVQSIQVSGNQVVPTDKILELMETKPGEVLNTRVLHSDIQNINKYYNEDLGYLLQPTHVVGLDWTPDGILRLTLQDGMIVKSIEVTGVSVFPIEEVRALVKTEPGQLFNQKILREDSTRIAELYEKNDYILDTIRPSIDPETGAVSLNVVEAVVEAIKVEGNKKTQTATILRNLRTKPGDVLQKRRIQKDLERLNNLGYFKKVDIEPQPGTEPGKVVLLLKVEEQKTGLATIGVGYAGGGSGAVRPGITGAVSFSDRNLFGEGKAASIQLQRGAQIQTYGISYSDPAINDNQDSVGVNLFYSRVDGLQQPVPGQPTGTFAIYTDRRYGGSASYGRTLSDDWRAFITLRRETIEIIEDEDSDFTPFGVGKGDLNSVSLASLFDTRDDVFNPHLGQYANGSFTVSGGLLGGSFDFTKLQAEYRHYLPLGARQTLATRIMGGILNGGAPLSEFFFVGGTDTLRAYRDNSFFGNRFVVANVEYRFPLFNIKFLNGAVFADGGGAWIPGTTAAQLHGDAGVGLRIVFPSLGLGVIRVDYAHGDQGGRTTIGIGQSF